MAWQKIVDTKMNQDFTGHAEKCIYTFSLGPEQVPGMSMARDYIVNSHVKELAKENSRLLELRVWEDTAPTWQTNYYVEIVATASPLWWNLIIGGTLLLLIGIAIYFTIEKIEDVTKYIGEEAGGVGISLSIVAVISAVALAGLVLWKRKFANPRRISGKHRRVK